MASHPKQHPFAIYVKNFFLANKNITMILFTYLNEWKYIWRKKVSIPNLPRIDSLDELADKEPVCKVFSSITFNYARGCLFT